MRCCFHSFKDLLSLPAPILFERDAKVGGFRSPSKYFYAFFCGIYDSVKIDADDYWISK